VGALAPDIAVDTDFLEAYCAPVLEAIDRITDWATTE
jgi:hypothetical protein